MGDSAKTTFRKAWQVWKSFAHRLGKIQTTIIVSLFYFLVVGLVWLVSFLLRKDLLNVRRRNRPTFWVSKEPMEVSWERAKRMF